MRGIGLGALAGSTLVAVTVWLLSYPNGPPGDRVISPAVFWFLVIAWGCVAVWWLVTLGRLAYHAAGRRWDATKPLAAIAGAVLLAFGVASFAGLAVRVRLELSKDQLERVARERPANRSTPLRAGLYRVEEVTRGSRDSIVLITNRCGLGRCGFAYSPRGAPPDVCADSDHQEYDHVTGPWYEAYLADAGTCG